MKNHPFQAKTPPIYRDLCCTWRQDKSLIEMFGHKFWGFSLQHLHLFLWTQTLVGGPTWACQSQAISMKQQLVHEIHWVPPFHFKPASPGGFSSQDWHVFQSCSLIGPLEGALFGKQDFEPLSYKYHNNKYTFGPSIESVMANFGGISGGSAPLLPPNVLDLAKLVPLLLRRLRRPDAPGAPEDFTQGPR